MRNHQSQSGFTLVEMIVSLALFSVVITISVGALLILVASNRQLQDDQSILTNLSFALDSMTREIRTGTGYFCVNSSGLSGMFAVGDPGPPDTSFQDCPVGRTNNVQGISFVEGGDSISGGSGSNRIVYFYDSTASSRALYRRVGTGPAQPITSDGLLITDAEFFVSGSEPLFGSTDVTQPTVTIFLEAAAGTDPLDKRYQIQTTVVQRSLDL